MIDVSGQTAWDAMFTSVPAAPEGGTTSLSMARTVAVYLVGTSETGDDVLILDGVYVDSSGKIVALEVHGFPVQIQGDPAATNRSWTILSTTSYTIVTSNGPKEYTIVGAGTVNGRSPEGVRNWISANYGKKHWSYEYQCYSLAADAMVQLPNLRRVLFGRHNPLWGTAWWRAKATVGIGSPQFLGWFR